MLYIVLTWPPVGSLKLLPCAHACTGRVHHPFDNVGCNPHFCDVGGFVSRCIEQDVAPRRGGAAAGWEDVVPRREGATGGSEDGSQERGHYNQLRGCGSQERG